VNTAMPYHVVDAIAGALNGQKKSIKGSKLLILGVAYKKDVDDLRESPTLKIMQLLQERGAHLDYNDPYFPRLHKMRHYNYENMKSVSINSHTLGNYDAVIIAAPYHSSHIALPADLSTLIPPQPYVHLHTTLLTTTAATLNPVYFGYKPGSKVATNVVTTFDGVGHDGRASEFNFISYQGQAKFAKNETHDGQETGEWVVKISSTERISDEWLATMFQNQVGWVQRKEWDAYPVLSPTTKFPPIRLDDGLFYVNAIEPFISSMEAETLASRNIVDLLMQERFNASICPLEEGKEGGAEHVHGWDC